MNPLAGAARMIWSLPSQRAIYEILTSSDLTWLTSITPSPKFRRPLTTPAARLVYQSFRLFTIIVCCARPRRCFEAAWCARTVWAGGGWPGILHACYRNSRPQTAVVAAMLALHGLLGTWREMVDVYVALGEFSRRKFVEAGLPESKILVKPHFVCPGSWPTRERRPIRTLRGTAFGGKGYPNSAEGLERSRPNTAGYCRRRPPDGAK